jgi:hypothetical protein
MRKECRMEGKEGVMERGREGKKKKRDRKEEGRE